jgi:trehalose-6-phosphatase
MTVRPQALHTTSSKLDRFLRRLSSTHCSVLIATNFDGTLLPLAPSPEGAQLTDRARAILARLTRVRRVRLAVLTNRPLADIAPRLEGLGPLWISAEHGAVLVDSSRRLHVRANVPSAGSDKGIALARILGTIPLDSSFVYAGDDATDEPALAMAALSENGLGLYVQSAARPMPAARVSGLVDGPDEWLGILRLFAEALEEEARRAS